MLWKIKHLWIVCWSQKKPIHINDRTMPRASREVDFTSGQEWKKTWQSLQDFRDVWMTMRCWCHVFVSFYFLLRLLFCVKSHFCHVVLGTNGGTCLRTRFGKPDLGNQFGKMIKDNWKKNTIVLFFIWCYLYYDFHCYFRKLSFGADTKIFKLMQNLLTTALYDPLNAF